MSPPVAPIETINPVVVNMPVPIMLDTTIAVAAVNGMTLRLTSMMDSRMLSVQALQTGL
jgi:hypothetical protein